MAEYVLTTERLRVVKRNDRGQVILRKRFKRGDVVTDLDEAREQQLINSGALVPKGELEADEADSSTPEEPENQEDPSGDPGDGAEGEDEGEDEDEEDRYDAMSYPELQHEAKSRGLSGAGSAEELRTRLREADADDNAV